MVIRPETKTGAFLTAQKEHWLATHILVADTWQLLKSVPYHRWSSIKCTLRIINDYTND